MLITLQSQVENLQKCGITKKAPRPIYYQKLPSLPVRRNCERKLKGTQVSLVKNKTANENKIGVGSLRGEERVGFLLFRCLVSQRHTHTHSHINITGTMKARLLIAEQFTMNHKSVNKKPATPPLSLTNIRI